MSVVAVLLESEKGDIHTLASILRLRAKNFHKVLRAVSLQMTRYSGEKSLCDYFPKHTLWSHLSEAELMELKNG